MRSRENRTVRQWIRLPEASTVPARPGRVPPQEGGEVEEAGDGVVCFGFSRGMRRGTETRVPSNDG
jgi:hypothetical protein